MPVLPNVVASFTPGSALLAYISAIVTLHYGKLWLEGRKLSSEDKQANREGFTKQVESLWAENRLLRQEYDLYRKRCEEETADLRKQIIELKNTQVGMMRQVDDRTIRDLDILSGAGLAPRKDEK